MNEIAVARDRLHAQLVKYTATVPGWSPERVHRYTPTIIASPTMWIGQPGTSIVLTGSAGGRVRVVTFGVFIVPDGYEPKQCELLDELVARVAEAVYNLHGAEDAGALPQSVDVGGTTVRAVVHDVSLTVFAHSFCPSALTPLQSAAPEPNHEEVAV